jgi:hypothetical protein
MQNWKKAVIAGSFAGGALLVFKGYRTAAVVAASAGAIVLASEYPDELRRAWERAPEYLDRATVIVAAISRIRDRLEQEGSRAIASLGRDVRNAAGY